MREMILILGIISGAYKTHLTGDYCRRVGERTSENLLLLKSNENPGEKNGKIYFFRALKINQGLITTMKPLFKKNGWISLRSVSYVAF
jgi:hypothetical protein